MYNNILLTCCYGNQGSDSIFCLSIFIAMTNTFAFAYINGLKRMKFHIFGVKVHSHVCFKATYKWLIEQLASIPLVESDFLATSKLLCSIHGNVKRKTNKVDRAKRMHCVRSERAVAITLVMRRL
jgi:hypothetical protein